MASSAALATASVQTTFIRMLAGLLKPDDVKEGLANGAMGFSKPNSVSPQ